MIALHTRRRLNAVYIIWMVPDCDKVAWWNLRY